MVFSEKELSLINDTIITIYSTDDLKDMRNNLDRKSTRLNSSHT